MGIRVRNTTKGVDKYFTWNIQDLRPLLLFPIIKGKSATNYLFIKFIYLEIEDPTSSYI